MAESDLNLFNFEDAPTNPNGELALTNSMIRGSRNVETFKITRSDGAVINRKKITSNDKKLEDTMIEIFSAKSEKKKINYKKLLDKASLELEKDFIKYDVIESPSKTKAANLRIKEIRQIALNNYVKSEVIKLIPKLIEIDVKDFIKRTGIVRIQNRFEEALSLFLQSSGKMTDSWNEAILSDNYDTISYDIVYGSVVPKFRIRCSEQISEFVDPNSIKSLDQLIKLDIPNKAKYIDKLILEIDPAAVLEILGIGLWNNKGHTNTFRKDRNKFKKSTSFDLDYLARSIINIPHIKQLTHLTFEQLKSCLGASSYTKWDSFKKSVFAPAIAELNANTNMDISFKLYPNQRTWTHIHLIVKYKTVLLNSDIKSKFGFDPLAFFIATRHRYFQRNKLTGSLGGLINYVKSYISAIDDDGVIYGKTLSEWKIYAVKSFESEHKILSVLIETPTILSSRNMKYDELLMTIVNVNNFDEEYSDESEITMSDKSKKSDTSYINTSRYKVTDPIKSLLYITEYIHTEESNREKANIFDFIPFELATLDMNWEKIDSMEKYVDFKDPIRLAVYSKKKTYFRFIDQNGKVEENKKELFITYLEEEKFKEIDNKFKELLMSASS